MDQMLQERLCAALSARGHEEDDSLPGGTRVFRDDGDHRFFVDADGALRWGRTEYTIAHPRQLQARLLAEAMINYPSPS